MKIENCTNDVFFLAMYFFEVPEVPEEENVDLIPLNDQYEQGTSQQTWKDVEGSVYRNAADYQTIYNEMFTNRRPTWRQLRATTNYETYLRNIRAARHANKDKRKKTLGPPKSYKNNFDGYAKIDVPSVGPKYLTSINDYNV